MQHTSGTASLTVSGTFTGTPTAIEYRYKGGSWATLDAAPTGGVFSESITLNRGDQGTLEVRFTNDTDASASATFVGCGEVFAIFGQSNASGRGTNNRTYSHATLKVGQYTGNGWQEMADPIDANANVLDSVADDTSTPGGHWAHKMCTDLMAGLEVPIGVLVVAKGGTGIASFLPGADHLDRTTLYGSLNFHCNAVGGVKAVLWWQGETDAIAAMTQATYNGHLDTIANALQADRGVPLIACLLQNSSGITDGDEQAIRDAVTEAVGDNANVLQGPDFSSIASDDAFHLQTDTKVDNAGASWATSIFAELLPTVTLTEPSGIVLTGEVETLQWTTLGVSSVDVELSTDGGSNYTAIDSGNSGTSHAWTPATSQLSSNARIRVVDASDASVSDVSGALKVATTSAVGGNYADPADVRSGTDRGDGTLGTLAVPSEGTVLEGVSVDGTVGNYHPTTPAETASGVSFGSNSSEVGTFVGSGGSGTDHSEQLDRIEAAVTAQTPPKITLVSPVTLGGDITLIKGSDYRVRSATAVLLKVNDVGGAMAAVLKDSGQTASIVVAAGRGKVADEIVGSLEAANITTVDNVTTLPLEFTAAATSTATTDDYEYHIKGISPVVNGEAAGDEVVRIEGCLTLRPERATAGV